MYKSPVAAVAARSVVATLMPVMIAVLAGFIIIGLALPVLPLHVSNDLGFSPIVVGLVAGAQFAASLFSRVWAGSFSDWRGAKRAVLAGLVAAVVAGLLYLLSLAFLKVPTLSVAILLAGRAVLGGAESFIITGAVAWGLALVDRQHAGKVIAWVGTAMFAAMASAGQGLRQFSSSLKRRACCLSGWPKLRCLHPRGPRLLGSVIRLCIRG